MIDQLRAKLDYLHEDYVEKGAHFKVRVIPYFCAIKIKKQHKPGGPITFYSNQLLELFLALLFLLFGLSLFDQTAGFTHGPIHIVIAVLISFNLILKQIAIEGLKTRLALCSLPTKTDAEIH